LKDFSGVDSNRQRMDLKAAETIESQLAGDAHPISQSD
jgi:hypothetical protein